MAKIITFDEEARRVGDGEADPARLRLGGRSVDREHLDRRAVELRREAVRHDDLEMHSGGRERLQVFEGVVIARKGGGVRETITVRKTSFGVGVERIFPLHATIIDRIDVVKRGRVRRAKLYYLRGLRGKAARIRERDTRQTTGGQGSEQAQGAASAGKK